MPTSKIYTQVEQEYDKTSKSFQESYNTISEFEPFVKGFISEVKQNFSEESELRLLNIGGTADECEHFINQGFQVDNIDISKKMLDFIKLKNLEVNLIHKNFTEFITHQKYHAVWASRSLIHIPVVDFYNVLCKVNNMLHENGTFASVFFTTEQNDTGIDEKYVSYKDDEGDEYSYYRVDYNVEKLSNLFDSAGFVINNTSITQDQDNENVVYIQAQPEDLENEN
jgi:SAM-dependent methyltransferase